MEDDIYKSKRKYEQFVQQLASFAIRPECTKTERVSFRLNRALLSKIEAFAEQREDTVSRSVLALIKAGFDHVEQAEKIMKNVEEHIHDQQEVNVEQ